MKNLFMCLDFTLLGIAIFFALTIGYSKHQSFKKIVINSDYHEVIAFSDNGTTVDKERVNTTVYITIDTLNKVFKIGDKIYTITRSSYAYDPKGMPCNWNMTKKIFVLKYKYISTVYHINYIQK